MSKEGRREGRKEGGGKMVAETSIFLKVFFFHIIRRRQGEKEMGREGGKKGGKEGRREGDGPA